MDMTVKARKTLSEIQNRFDSDGFFNDEANSNFYLGVLWGLTDLIVEANEEKQRKEAIERLNEAVSDEAVCIKASKATRGIYE